MTPTTLTPELQRAFLSLACQLSPENLTCDGERSRSAVRQVYRQLRAKWTALEKQAGRRVSEDEVWAAEFARSRQAVA